MSNSSPRIWPVIPAAGIGKRVGGNIPKQYQSLNGRPLIAWTLDRLLALSDVEFLTVVISAEDGYWHDLDIAGDSRVRTVDGGSERCYSVLNGLLALKDQAADDDWVLVHDAARPCVRVSDINHLIQRCTAENMGGILAIPVRDTIKKSLNNNRIENTVNRDSLWHALTPQLFKYAELHGALEKALDEGFQVTDEASAMENAGFQPLLVEGASDNIKVTLPADLDLAGFFITNQDKSR